MAHLLRGSSCVPSSRYSNYQNHCYGNNHQATYGYSSAHYHRVSPSTIDNLKKNGRSFSFEVPYGTQGIEIGYSPQQHAPKMTWEHNNGKTIYRVDCPAGFNGDVRLYLNQRVVSTYSPSAVATNPVIPIVPAAPTKPTNSATAVSPPPPTKPAEVKPHWDGHLYVKETMDSDGRVTYNVFTRALPSSLTISKGGKTIQVSPGAKLEGENAIGLTSGEVSAETQQNGYGKYYYKVTVAAGEPPPTFSYSKPGWQEYYVRDCRGCLVKCCRQVCLPVNYTPVQRYLPLPPPPEKPRESKPETKPEAPQTPSVLKPENKPQFPLQHQAVFNLYESVYKVASDGNKGIYRANGVVSETFRISGQDGEVTRNSHLFSSSLGEKKLEIRSESNQGGGHSIIFSMTNQGKTEALKVDANGKILPLDVQYIVRDSKKIELQAPDNAEKFVESLRKFHEEVLKRQASVRELTELVAKLTTDYDETNYAVTRQIDGTTLKAYIVTVRPGGDNSRSVEVTAPATMLNGASCEDIDKAVKCVQKILNEPMKP